MTVVRIKLSTFYPNFIVCAGTLLSILVIALSFPSISHGQVFESSWQWFDDDISSFSAALGDVDGDGDLDAWVANSGTNWLWLNDGNGTFTDSGQAMGSSGNSVALGDVDGDGDLDAWVVNSIETNRVWVNDGNGIFTDSGQVLGGSISVSVALGDVDGDGDQDTWVANLGANRVWLNIGYSAAFDCTLNNLDSHDDGG